MALPNINITLLNGQLGTVSSSDDGVMGLILQGVAISGTLALNTGYTIFGLDDAAAIGIDEAYDVANSVKCYKHIKEFYDESGEGSELCIIVLAQSETLVTMFQAGTVRTTLSNWLAQAGGRINCVAVTRSPASGYSAVITTGINSEVLNGSTHIKSFAQSLVAQYMPSRFIVEGRNIAYSNNASALLDIKTLTNDFMCVVVGDTSATSVGAAVGYALGRAAKVPVQRNIGRVLDGATTATNIYFGGLAVTPTTSNDLVAALHNKGFITFRTHVRRAGYYFTDDLMATTATSDYAFLARGRVIDKCVRLAYDTYVAYLNDEFQLDPATGFLQAAEAKGLQTAIERVIGLAMVGTSELSGIRCLVNPAQNVKSTNKIAVKLYPTPVAYGKEIEVEIGFDNQ